jgi:hypothetical protein
MMVFLLSACYETRHFVAGVCVLDVFEVNSLIETFSRL